MQIIKSFKYMNVKNQIKFLHIQTNLQFPVKSKNVKIIYRNNIIPKVVKKKYEPALISRLKVQTEKSHLANVEFKTEMVEKEQRVNEINLQMLSKNLYDQIFKTYDQTVVPQEAVQNSLKELKNHGIEIQNVKYVPDVKLNLPPLRGKNLIDHFKIIGEEQAKPYQNLINDLLKGIPLPPKVWLQKAGWVRYAPESEPQEVSHPLEDAMIFDVEVCLDAGKMPTLATAVSNKAWYGWVSHSLINLTKKPLQLLHNLENLIPLENESKGYSLSSEFCKPRIVVGHNVSFDRSKVREQYYFEKTGLRFIDTMSLHICISGITSYQRAILKSEKKNEEETWTLLSSLNSLTEVHKLYCGSEINKATRDIFIEGTLIDVKNEFNNVMQYCAEDVLATYNVLKILFPLFLKRFPHPVTFAGMLELGMAYLPVNKNWNRYINECEQNYQDLNTESKFLLTKRADQACELLHDEKYKNDLWMWDQNWCTQDIKIKKNLRKKKKKLEKNKSVEHTGHASDEKLKINVQQKCFLKVNLDNLEYIENSQISENTKHYLSEVTLNDENSLENKFEYLFEMKNLLHIKKLLLPGYPLWYRKLCTKFSSNEDWVPEPKLISTSMQVTPKLLSLMWEGYPLHYIREKGWGFLIPYSDTVESKQIPIKALSAKCPFEVLNHNNYHLMRDVFQKEIEKNLTQKEWWKTYKHKNKPEKTFKSTGIWCNVELENCCWFMKLPHKKGASHNVGNPLARDFLEKFSNNILSGDSESAEKVLSIARKLSYWRNNRDRIMQQVVIWLKHSEIPENIRLENYQLGVILPQVVVCGTLTRRAIEPTWMTASNVNNERIGSELRAMIQAPPGYSIVGADVDSQELWIASVLGDAHFAKMHGASPLGWMTLIGTKSEGTDMHSITAKAVGISRDHAKVINYARIYGAGINFAERLLKQFNPTMTEQEAKSKASKMFVLTKGKKIYHLKSEFSHDFPNKTYSTYQAYEIAKAYGKSINELFDKSEWIGGSESAMFNRLEQIAANSQPVTPFLECHLSRALEPQVTLSDDKFLPTRINWIVQSGAVDFLHLMLVTMRWLMKDNIRFCLSFHDEVRYLVANEFKYDAALAMHITNLLVRTFCSMKLGINDLPMSVAFFSSVEVDTVLRKDSHNDSKTPSNSHGLEKGYKIKNGESLNIQKCIEKTNGEISLWK